jgi:tetratricopeptide (TPR) repeat protein
MACVTPRFVVLLVLVAVFGALAQPAAGNPASERLRRLATHELYNLEPRKAADLYRQAIAADPNDAAAHRGLAGAAWMEVNLLRGTMTVDSYLGRVTGEVKLPPPPAELARTFHDAVERAIALAEARIEASPDDAQAQYEFGAAIGLRASYVATIDGTIMKAFRSARGAFDAHERVLELDPSRHDAGLIVGTYRYLVAALSLPLRWAAYIVGFGGGRERGIELVERAANYPGDNQSDARVALVLLYNRERRYDDALEQLSALRTRFPGNRLLWLETGSTLLRAGRSAEAERVLTEGMNRLAGDHRMRMFGEEALWHYRRGTARAALGRRADAQADLQKALASAGRKWVHGRTHLELAKLAQSSGNDALAKSSFRAAIELADADADPRTADEARRLLRAD